VMNTLSRKKDVQKETTQGHTKVTIQTLSKSAGSQKRRGGHGCAIFSGLQYMMTNQFLLVVP